MTFYSRNIGGHPLKPLDDLCRHAKFLDRHPPIFE